jgi:phosphopentomutase
MRVILLVLDGLGVGEMPDVALVRPQDRGANTLRSLMQNTSGLNLDNLRKLGLGKIIALPGLETLSPGPLASYGRSRLAHFGADSYLGHQEIVGTIPKMPVKTLMSQAAPLLETQLVACGHRVERPLDGKNVLLVDNALLIGDNLEADPGLIINLTVATDLIPFDEALKIGQVVRDHVQTSRVIVFGGPGIDVNDILQHVRQPDNGQIGVDSPALGVYNEHLYVQHMGYGVDPTRQAPFILSQNGLTVVLVGKMADLIVCPAAIRNSLVPTPLLMGVILQYFRDTPELFIAATVQETDLSAHEGDVSRLASVLEQVDQGLGALLAEFSQEDVLIICADHGNDPRVNVGRHTREETPLLIYQKGQPSVSLGTRDTLADIGATITHLFHSPPTQDGAFINSSCRPAVKGGFS